jgi:hypothetical protein
MTVEVASLSKACLSSPAWKLDSWFRILPWKWMRVCMSASVCVCVCVVAPVTNPSSLTKYIYRKYRNLEIWVHQSHFPTETDRLTVIISGWNYEWLYVATYFKQNKLEKKTHLLYAPKVFSQRNASYQFSQVQILPLEYFKQKTSTQTW